VVPPVVAEIGARAGPAAIHVDPEGAVDRSVVVLDSEPEPRGFAW